MSDGNGHSTLRAWLDEQGLQEETVTVRGKQFLVQEIDLAERGRLITTHLKQSELTDVNIECLLLSRCVMDPATGKQVVPCDEWTYWRGKGSSFSPLVAATMRVNGLRDDAVEAEVKNSGTTDT